MSRNIPPSLMEAVSEVLRVSEEEKRELLEQLKEQEVEIEIPVQETFEKNYSNQINRIIASALDEMDAMGAESLVPDPISPNPGPNAAWGYDRNFSGEPREDPDNRDEEDEIFDDEEEDEIFDDEEEDEIFDDEDFYESLKEACEKVRGGNCRGSSILRILDFAEKMVSKR